MAQPLQPITMPDSKRRIKAAHSVWAHPQGGLKTALGLCRDATGQRLDRELPRRPLRFNIAPGTCVEPVLPPALATAASLYTSAPLLSIRQARRGVRRGAGVFSRGQRLIEQA